MKHLLHKKVGIRPSRARARAWYMINDFSDDELDLIFECLDERRMCSDDEEDEDITDTM